jgi:transcriptional regulator with XRE-family HTH domain
VPAVRERMRLKNRDAFMLERRRHGTLREVAETAEVSHQYLHELETGAKAACSRAIALGISAALGRPLDFHFESVDAAGETTEEARKVS